MFSTKVESDVYNMFSHTENCCTLFHKFSQYTYIWQL